MTVQARRLKQLQKQERRRERKQQAQEMALLAAEARAKRKMEQQGMLQIGKSHPECTATRNMFEVLTKILMYKHFQKICHFMVLQFTFRVEIWICLETKVMILHLKQKHYFLDKTCVLVAYLLVSMESFSCVPKDNLLQQISLELNLDHCSQTCTAISVHYFILTYFSKSVGFCIMIFSWYWKPRWWGMIQINHFYWARV